MPHNMSVLMALLKEPNNTVFQKTLALSDFSFRDRGAIADKDAAEYPLDGGVFAFGASVPGLPTSCWAG